MKRLFLLLLPMAFLFSCSKDKNDLDDLLNNSLNNSGNSNIPTNNGGTSNNGNTGGNNTGTGNSNSLGSGPYFAKFSFQSDQINWMYGDQFAQLLVMNENVVGGSATPFDLISAGGGFTIKFTFDHNPTNQEVLALQGQTFLQDQPNGNITMNCNFTKGIGLPEFESFEISNNYVYSIKFTSITYKRQQHTSFNEVDVFEVKGYGKLNMKNTNSSEVSELTDLTFDMLISSVQN